MSDQNRSGECAGRRKFLQGTGGLAASIMAFSVGAAANEDDDEATLAGLGLRSEYNELVDNGKYSQADELLNSHNVKGSTTKTPVRTFDQSGDGEFSTQANFKKSESSVYISNVNVKDDIYQIMGSATLDGTTNDWSSADNVLDAMGITYDNDEWSTLDPSKDNLRLHCTSFEGDTDGAPDVEMDEYNPNNGVAASVDFKTVASIGYRTVLTMATDLQDVSRNGITPTPVKFEYQQNSATSEWAAGISIAVGPVGLQVDLDNANKAWDKAVTAGIGERDEE